MKKIINDPTEVVDEMLEGLAYIHSDLVYRVEGFDIIARKSEKTGKVGLISGGGSGHEPSHAGFVGEGMLSAAICGAVFTSPTPDQVLQAIKEGVEVASFVVDDDIAVEDSLYTQGRRGVAGTILVHKILGDAARAGKSLTEIKALADELVKHIHTVGLALSGATVPEVGKPGFVLADDEIEFGIGIHGEPGYRKEKMQPSKDLAKELVEKLSQSVGFKSGKKIGILINGMGATPLMEQYVFAADVANLLADAGVEVVYKKLGNYMTSIDMAGISLTFIELDQPDWLTALNSPVTTAAW